jgi:short-subunit dehydrogenase
MDTLHGKTALVTGASSGLGSDFARELAARGCSLVLTARRMDRLERLQKEIEGRHPVKVETIAADLAAAGAAQGLYDGMKSRGLSVDVLINNAGCAVFGEFRSADWERTQRMLAVDVVALTHLTRLFTADMAARKYGYLLLVASTGAFQPTPTYAAYAAAKSYVLYFGEALHSELRPIGVGCTVVCPGVTRTEFFDVAGQQMTPFQRLTAMDSAAVARTGIRAMLAYRSCVVVGAANSLIARLAPLLPRQLMAAMAARMMR